MKTNNIEIEPNDLALAQRLLHPYEYSNDTQRFIGYLFAAMRQGHLCVNFEDLDPILVAGAQKIPKELIGTSIIQYESSIYFHRHWQQESRFMIGIKNICSHPPRIVIDPLLLKQKLQGLSLGLQQATAIENACKNTLFLLTGGPGTGKTYTAGQFIKIFWETLTSEQRKKCEIALAAPTGKAAAHLQSSLTKALHNLENPPQLQAKTLHSLLYNIEPSEFLSADLILVDESSMIDANMMGRLVQTVKPGARLILIGDKKQLPPVEAGGFFGDLIDVFSTSEKLKQHVVELDQCLRTDLKEIVECARLINEGNVEQCLALLTQLNGSIQWHPLDLDSILKHKYTDSFRILSPLKKGPYGVDALNDRLAKLSAKQSTFPIMILKNDEKMRLFNGETGILFKQSLGNDVKVGDYAQFTDEEIRKIPALLLPPYSYAYCLSVHKSQGSEFDHVALILPEGSERFGREVLYTAVTRAKKKLTLYASQETLIKTLQNKSTRFSGLQKRFF